MNLTLRRLSVQEDAPHLQDVLEAAPRYSLSVSGAPQPADAAEQVFAARPDQFDAANKFVFGLEINSRMIGCIDVLRGFPNTETAMLGLLLLRESHQSQGLGSLAFGELEKELRSWPEIRIVRISVVDANREALMFWKKLGFRETGVRRPYQNGSVSSEAVVLEKPISAES